MDEMNRRGRRGQQVGDFALFGQKTDVFSLALDLPLRFFLPI
jgi:hypothetical protein